MKLLSLLLFTATAFAQTHEESNAPAKVARPAGETTWSYACSQPLTAGIKMKVKQGEKRAFSFEYPLANEPFSPIVEFDMPETLPQGGVWKHKLKDGTAEYTEDKASGVQTLTVIQGPSNGSEARTLGKVVSKFHVRRMDSKGNLIEYAVFVNPNGEKAVKLSVACGQQYPAFSGSYTFPELSSPLPAPMISKIDTTQYDAQDALKEVPRADIVKGLQEARKKLDAYERYISKVYKTPDDAELSRRLELIKSISYQEVPAK